MSVIFMFVIRLVNRIVLTYFWVALIEYIWKRSFRFSLREGFDMAIGKIQAIPALFGR